MDTRKDWVNAVSDSDFYYSASETINDVIESFNFRRKYSAEGASVVIDGSNTSEDVIIQDHSNPINEGKTDKKILVPNDSNLHTGSIVSFNGGYWLTVSHVNSVGGAYKSAQIDKCNYNLQFLKADGSATSRWCIITEPSGDISDNKYVAEGSNRFLIKLPLYSGDSFKLGDRFLLNSQAYKVIRVDDISENYGANNGLVLLLVEYDEVSPDDNLSLGIANYYSRYKSTILSNSDYASIEYSGNPELRVNAAYKTFAGKFYDKDKKLLVPQPKAVWSLTLTDNDDLPYVSFIESNNTIKVKVTNINMIGKVILLNLKSEDNVLETSLPIGVIAL